VGKLTASQEREQKILLALSEGSEDYGHYPFDFLTKRTGIERRQVRVDVRRLARKGLTVFGRGLWNDDGELAGSGYAITQAGRAALSSEQEK
jgi:RIO-like serine/threonine protein kinase